MARLAILALLCFTALVTVHATEVVPETLKNVEKAILKVLPKVFFIEPRSEASNIRVFEKLEKNESPGDEARAVLPVESGPVEATLQVEGESNALELLNNLIETVKTAAAAANLPLSSFVVSQSFPDPLDNPNSPTFIETFDSRLYKLSTSLRHRRVNGVYFSAKYPAKGGIRIQQPPTGPGTLGGFIYKAGAKAKPYALTNQHVAPTQGTNVNQPDGGAKFGAVVGAAQTANPHVDVSFISVDAGKEVRCSIRGIGDVTGVHALGKYAAADDIPANAVGQAVQKSGCRSHITVGRIIQVNRIKNVGGNMNRYHFIIRGTGTPKFFRIAQDHDYGRTRDAASNTWGDNNEPNLIRSNFENFLRTTYGHTAIEATNIFNQLGTNALITVFSFGGDSGSFIMVGTEVAGQMDAGGYTADFFPDGDAVNKPALCTGNVKCVWDAKVNRWWRGLHKETYAMSIKASLDKVNELDPNQNYEICIEQNRLQAVAAAGH